MEKKEAINVVAQACAAFKGTLQDHQTLQQALEVLKADVEPKPEPAGDSEPAE